MSLEWTLLALRLAAAALLYLFLGLAFYIIWKELKEAVAPAGSPPALASRLRVVSTEVETLLTAGQILPLQPVTGLGRDAHNTIVIPHPTASARHARLVCDQNEWWLEDLGSTNGTTLNGLPLSKPAPLAHGDVIGIGAVSFMLELGDKQPAIIHD
jgi:hypothetical protein